MMVNGNLEDICGDDLKNNPHRTFGDKLPSYFWDLMQKTDKWINLPFTTDERFIDFARGLTELSGAEIPKYNNLYHNNATGFFLLDQQKPLRSIKLPFAHEHDFIPWVAYLNNGNAVYAQAEVVKDGIIDRKTQIFSKDNFTLEVRSSKNDAYACWINFVCRESRTNLAEGYELRISHQTEEKEDYVQRPHEITIGIYDNNDILNLGHDPRQVPIIEVTNSANEYILNGLDKLKGSFTTLPAITKIFGTDEISDSSKIYEIRRQRAIGTSAAHAKTEMTFEEAVAAMQYIAGRSMEF